MRQAAFRLPRSVTHPA